MKKERVKKYWYNILLPLIIFLGIMLRLKGFIANPSFWHDECAVAWNVVFKDYGQLFGVLRFLQMAPPLFLVATKFLTQLFGQSEIVFRLIPFLAGCFSIPAFYLLADKVLKVKSTVFWAVFFFAINMQLINYSFEFKPYGVDVFLTIITLLFFVRFNIETIKKWQLALSGSLFAILPWVSFVSVFVIAGGFLNIIVKNIKKDWGKKIILMLPVFFSILVYLKIYLHANYAGSHMINYWENSFVTLNPAQFIYLLSESVRYLFFPVQYVLFALILLVWGAIDHYREKTAFFGVAIASFALLLIASLLRIYPFSGRLVLFLIPVFLLFMIKPVDSLSYDKKIKTIIILSLTFFSLCPQIFAVNAFSHQKHVSRGENPREMMKIMVKKLKKDDIIFVNNASNTEFAYYSSFHNLKNNVIQEKLSQKPDEKYFQLLNKLPKGNYWFYMPYDYSHSKVVPVIELWAKSKEMLYTYKNNASILIYLSIK